MPFQLTWPEELTEEQALVEARKRYRRMLQRSSPGGLALELALLQVRYGAMDRLENELTKHLPQRLPPGDPRLVLHYIPDQMFHFWLGQDVAEAMADFERGRGTLELAAPLLEILETYRTDLFPKITPEAADATADKLRGMLEAERRRLWLDKLTKLVVRRSRRNVTSEEVEKILQVMEARTEYEEYELESLATDVASYLPFV